MKISSIPTQDHMIFDDNRLIPALYGEQNTHLRHIEKCLNISLDCRGTDLFINGDKQNQIKARHVLEALWGKLQQGEDIDISTIDSALRFLEDRTHNNNVDSLDESTPKILIRKKIIQPRSPLQAAYISAMQSSKLVFSTGPAGTGKTYLAVAHAVSLLEDGKVERIILSRPAVEAGERIGFLPGEMKEKMDPYMRPLYDALHYTMPADKLMKRLASEEIEIAPLAFMRGRTLNNAAVILDEAQNATENQMLMFLTRVGEHSHMVVTGDPSQTDLPKHEKSGLVQATAILNDTPDISVIQFTGRDVVRSALVSSIIGAYEKHKKTTER